MSYWRFLATTLNDTDDKVYVSFPIIKMEDDPESGGLYVWGKATDGSLDSDEQIVDTDWSAKALGEWLTTGANVRVMHSPYLYPAGKGVEVATSDDGHFVKALVIEETAKRLCKAGVLQAYSVGISKPKTIRDSVAKNGRIVGGTFAEISLVDRPANANCGIKIVKSVGDVPANAEELFGKLDEAIALAEKSAAPTTTTTSTRQGHDDLPDELLVEWKDARDQFLRTIPEGDDSPEREAWKAEKDLFYAGTIESRKTWLCKRNMVTPQDVHDAARLVEHADNPDQARQRVVAIARQKGQAFVSELPSSWSEVEKGEKDCPKCGKGYDADAKSRVCEKCGGSLPSADKSVTPEVTEVSPPAASVDQFAEAIGIKSVAGNQDDTDDTAEDDDEDDFPPPKKKADTPYAVKRLHDFLCPVFSDGDVLSEYASVKSWTDAIDVEKVREFLGDEAATEAAELKSADPDLLTDARAQLHKSFTDMYPDASVSPSNVVPGSFKRGPITAGRARDHASGADSGARVPPSNQTISPDQFTRGPLTDGQERPSPSNKSAPPGFAEGSASYAANVLQGLHDRIANNHGAICAFADTKSEMPEGMNASETLTPVTPPKWARPEYIKGLVTAAMADEKAYYEGEIAALKAAVDELGAQPDPALAPVRGVVAKSAGSTKVTPVEKSSSVERREPTEDERLQAYAAKQLDSGDPLTRKRARDTLNALLASSND